MSTGINDPCRCNWCGNFHAFKCPLVKAIEYHNDGTQKRVEFFAPNDYPKLEAMATGPTISTLPGNGLKRSQATW